MMPAVKPTLEQLVQLAQELSPLDKVRLIERLAPDVEAALQGSDPAQPPVQLRSLRGILKGSGLADVDIDEARKEMWGNFPREDV